MHLSQAAGFIDPDPIGKSRWIIADKRIGQWVADRIPHLPNAELFGPFEALGVWDGERIIAGMVLHDCNKTYGNAQISFAADTPRWATRETIRALMAYPFEQLGLARVTTLTPSRNERALRFNRGLGFQKEGVMRGAFGNDDCVIMGLLKSEAPEWMLRD